MSTVFHVFASSAASCSSTLKRGLQNAVKLGFVMSTSFVNCDFMEERVFESGRLVGRCSPDQQAQVQGFSLCVGHLPLIRLGEETVLPKPPAKYLYGVRKAHDHKPI